MISIKIHDINKYALAYTNTACHSVYASLKFSR